MAKVFWEKIIDNLYGFYSEVSANSYLLIGSKNVLIDPGIHPEKEFLKVLNDLGFEEKDIDLILLTHSHADHFVNAKLFKNSEIWISKEDGKYLQLKDKFVTASQWFNNDYFPSNLNFFNGKEFDIGTFKLSVLELPGHTFGSVGFFDKKRQILFSGDTLFKGTCGRYDLVNSNKEMLKKSLEKLLTLNFSLLLPGHGPTYYASESKQKENIKYILQRFF